MKKILIICGPTATGKTYLAMKIAEEFNGEIVSADSRQVYEDLNIGTGKDLPMIKGTPIWGYDLVGPKKEFSVAAYLKFAQKIIPFIWKRRHLPIMVGGTGLYIKGVIDGISTVSVPQNQNLRKNLEDKKISELYEILAQLDPIKAASLNSSDSKNSRRLIRAIEVATWKLEIGGKSKEKENPISPESVLFIGLTAPKEILNKRIEERIDRWIKEGIEEEIQRLLKKRVSWDSQSMSSLGYRQWKDYFEGKASKRETIDIWKTEEKEYAKRQMTWFKRDKRINWFDSSTQDFVEKVEKLVKKWYSSN